MEIGVFEQGLKNHQIAPLRSFLTIQASIFKTETNRLGNDAHRDSIARFSNLLTRWQQILLSIITALRSSSNARSTVSSREFYEELCDITLSVSNQLVAMLIDAQCASDYFDEIKDTFVQKLFEWVKEVRNFQNQLRQPMLLHDRFDDSISTKSFDTSEWENLDSDDVIKRSLSSNKLILAQAYLARTRGLHETKWNTLCNKVFTAIIGDLTEQNIDDACKKLSSFGFSAEQVLRAVFRNTFDASVRKAVFNELVQAKKVTDDELESLKKLEMAIEIHKNKSLALNIKAVQLLSNEFGRLLLPGLFRDDMKDRCYEYVSPQLSWSTLLLNNEEDLLQKWIVSYVQTDSSYPLSWPISQEMTDMFYNANELTSENLLAQLAKNGIFQRKDGMAVNLIIKRLYSLAENTKLNLFSNSDEHPLNSQTSCINVNGFLVRVVEYAAKHELYDFLLWFAKTALPSTFIDCDIDENLKTLLVFYSTYVQGENDKSKTDLPLAIAKYLSNSSEVMSLEKLANESLENKQLRELLLYCLQYIPDVIFKSEPLTETHLKLLQAISMAMKNDYPVVSKLLNKIQGCESDKSPTVYELLNESTLLDISKLFTWQSKNTIHNTNSNCLKELPHFSHPQLAGAHGLKANLNFLFYIREGRPVEAFLQRSLKSVSITSKHVDSACDKAAVVAFFHCSKPEVAASAVIFCELLKNDSQSLRLHLAVSNLILAHAANYLALTLSSQVSTLGSLLKRATYHKDKLAPNRLLQLLVTALSKKYEYSKGCQTQECLEWHIAVKFSQLYNLEPPTEFLMKCAQHDDWLLFITFAQMYDYSKDAVLAILPSFNNGCISDHLQKAFKSSSFKNEHDNSPISILKGKKSNVSATHFRNTLYSRIGVSSQAVNVQKLTARTSSVPTVTEDDMRSVSSETDMTNLETLSVVSKGSVESDFMPERENPPKDFFALIVMCQKVNPTEVWRSILVSSIVFGNAPLSLLAVSLISNKSASAEFDCFCCWLSASFLENSKHDQTHSDNLDGIILTWSRADFLQLLQNRLKISTNYRVLLTGMKLFNFDKTPLTPLLDFLIDFHIEKEYYKSVNGIKAFQEQLWLMPDGGEVFLLDNKSFVEEVAVVLFEAAIQSIETTYELRILLRHFDFARVQSSFSSEVTVPDFRKLYRLCKCLSETDMEVSVLELIKIDEDSDQYQEFVRSITFSLQDRRYFGEAMQFATIAGIDLDFVIVSEWNVKSSATIDSIEFWQECLSQIEKQSISFDNIIHFMNGSIEKTRSIVVRTYLLAKKCLYNLKNKSAKEVVDECEICLWTDIIHLESETKLASRTTHAPNKRQEEIDTIWEVISTFGEFEVDHSIEYLKRNLKPNILTPDQYTTLDHIIGRLISAGNIKTANRVASLFEYSNVDLLIVEVSGLLANRNTLSQELVTKLDKIVPELELSEVLKEQLNQESIVYLLEKVTKFSSEAKSACQRIIALFKSSCGLSKLYSELVDLNDDLKIIKLLIDENHSSNADHVSLIKELATMNNISNDSLADLLCTEVLDHLRKYCYKPIKTGIQSSGTTNNFLSLLRILSDPSSLGKKLLNVIKEHHENYSQKAIVELYIKTHECFTTSSDIEGIAVVLRNVKCFVIQQLAINCDYHSMVRLLTGIGRYSEMTYIFDILRDNHEFEVLLGKGIEKNPQLRIALLDSLKGDKEMCPLVALNFSMHREIAEMLENDAMRIIKNIQIRHHHLPNFRDMLERSLHDIVDSSESYAKAACYQTSMRCEKLAELIALQISFLPSGPIVINLSKEAVADFLATHTVFAESMVVAEAYNSNDAWGRALYHNLIERNDWTYFREFQSRVQLTSSHLEDVVNKFLQNRQQGHSNDSSLAAGSVSLQKLLGFSSDAKVRYLLYKKLGFVSIAKNFLNEENNVYLKDLMSDNL